MTTSPAMLYTIFAPITDNSGQHITPARWNEIQHPLLEQAGGMTTAAPSLGLWIGPDGQVVQDLIVPIQVAMMADSEAERLVIGQSISMAQILEQDEIFVLAQPITIVKTNPT